MRWAWLVACAVVVALGVEWARFRVRWARYHFLRATRQMLRPHERTSIAGATHMAIAYLLALAIFPRPIAVAAMLYNGLGDATAPSTSIVDSDELEAELARARR